MSSVCVMQSVYDGVVQLKGNAGQHSVEFSITVDSTQNVSPVDAAQPLHRLAAKAQIKQLEDGEKGTLLLLYVGVLCHFNLSMCVECFLSIMSQLTLSSSSLCT